MVGAVAFRPAAMALGTAECRNPRSCSCRTQPHAAAHASPHASASPGRTRCPHFPETLLAAHALSSRCDRQPSSVVQFRRPCRAHDPHACNVSVSSTSPDPPSLHLTHTQRLGCHADGLALPSALLDCSLRCSQSASGSARQQHRQPPSIVVIIQRPRVCPTRRKAHPQI